MTEKKAFVFDTNFIIQNIDLNKVISNLNNEFSVYVTQLSIEERIAQQCRELKKRFDEILEFKEKNRDIASISLTTTYDKKEKDYTDSINKIYKNAFCDRIIPFSKDAETFSIIIDRANKKIPPFPITNNSSDKGFKDTILWLSLMNYFKENGEDEIIFVTDDGGFNKSSDILIEEFEKYTGKKISIKSNSFYNDLLKNVEKQNNAEEKQPVNISNINQLREEIKTIYDSLCVIESEDYYGNVTWNRTFAVSKYFDSAYIQQFFENLPNFISEHIFAKDINATELFKHDNTVRNRDSKIPMKNLEKAFDLYKNIKDCYPDYIQSFYDEVASIFNQNYSMPLINFDGIELPF